MSNLSPFILTTILPLILALFTSAILTWICRAWARKVDFVDRPGGHKGHKSPVALGGGIAVSSTVVLGILGGMIAAYLFNSTDLTGLPATFAVHLDGILSKAPVALAICAAAVVLCIVGVIDDKRSLPVSIRLAVQIAVAATLTIAFDLRALSHLHPVVSIGVSMMWMLILINSMNFLDNMDGLSSGVAAIAAAVFGMAAATSGQLFVPACCWMLVGALLGFLPFNFHPATIYLGDAGSTVVGLLLAVFTILTTFTSPAHGDQPFAVIAPLMVMAVPLYDTASVFTLRMRAGVPIWTGDRRHFSHRLLKRGMSVRKAVVVIWLTTLVTALPTLILPKANWLTASIILSQTILVVALLALIESSGPHGEKQG